MSDLFYLPNHETRDYYHEAVQAHVEDLRLSYMAEILCEARAVLSQLQASCIEPDTLIETITFDNKEGRKHVERTDDCWIITDNSVDRKQQRAINSPRNPRFQSLGNVAELTVAKSGFVLIESGRLILPYGSSSLIGTKAKLQYLKGHHDSNFVTSQNIGKDGYIDTGLMAGFERLKQRALYREIAREF